jgi:exopolysaccharide production protein ExoQ
MRTSSQFLPSAAMSTMVASVTAARTKNYVENGDPSLFYRARTWWLLLALFLMAQGNGLFTRQDSSYWKLGGEQYESVPIFFWLTILLWTLCAGLMFKWIGPTLRRMLTHKPLLAFVILAFLSILWSEQPQLTFRRAMLQLLTFAFAWFFATYYSPSDQMRILLAVGVIVAVASIAMALLLPQYGISSEGEWKGVFGHKNRMGLGIFFLFSALPFCRICSRRQLVTLALQAMLPIGLILLSQSRTSLILTAVLIAVRVFGPYIARRRTHQFPFVMYAVVCGIVIAVLATTIGREVIMPLLGKDATLTGRTDHWAVLTTFAAHHLWLGYGYYAFWTGTGDSLNVIRTIGGAMQGSDSGYMDTMLWFGLVGVCLLVVLLLASVRDFVSLFRRKFVPFIAYWYAGVVIGMYIGTFTETLFLTSVGITTFIFVVACAGLRSLAQQPILLNDE